MLFAGLFAQFAATPLGDTSPPGGEDRFATEPPMGSRIDIDLRFTFKLLSVFFAIAWWLLGGRFAFAWYLFVNVAAAWYSLCLRFVLRGIPPGRASGPAMLQKKTAALEVNIGSHNNSNKTLNELTSHPPSHPTTHPHPSHVHIAGPNSRFDLLPWFCPGPL